MTATTTAPPTKQRASKDKNSRRDPADIAANNFLKQTFKPVKKSIYLAWLCDVVNVLLLMVQAWVIVLIFDGWLLPFIPQFAHHDAMAIAALWLYLAVLFLVFVCRALVGYARDAILTRVGVQVAGDVRARLMAKLGGMGVARRFFGSDGVLASKVVDEPEHLLGFARFEVQKMTAVTTPILLAICISFFSKVSALILLATAPLVPIFMAIIGMATARKSREQMDAMGQLGGRFFDWIRGVNTLARLNAVQIATQDIERSSESYRQKTMDVLKIAFLNSAVLEFLSALSIALVAVYLGFGLMGILPWQTGVMVTSYSAALLILLLVPEFYAPLRRLGAEYHVKGQAQGAAKAMVDFLAFKPAQTGKTPLIITDKTSIRLDKVTVFGDDGRLRLPPTSLDFQAGQITGVQGQSGSGKSTILQVLLGFGQFTGTITFDNGVQMHSLDTLDIVKLREQIGYLAQTPALLPMSIADNLRLAKTDATDDELMAALDAVGLQDVVTALPQGLDTVLAERGGGLSGGQAHRLAIAQLLLQDAAIWLLDEPTEHLDAETAERITALLKRLAVGKTVIWVTHDDETAASFAVCHRLGAPHADMGA
ncbi:thiol reductant ABC exporter subunit CydD [Moraxella sp. FZFQ2102]|uniref:thiol reductant ABC exporter subunit CydD n=1 Tax=Moraxella sp. FZFQ2102 TaxID=2953752 RepID=UPI00209C277A|nr:thiol reductant ABC exporter subunit CydD [Moraxella sp. FZFQ2102]USZ14582.1 thiol reductant ABC exporter subunit CydD [Moraxella sp. FZFQ2102]